MIIPTESATSEQRDDLTLYLNYLVGPNNSDTIILRNGTVLSWIAILNQSSVMDLKNHSTVSLFIAVR